MAYRNGFLSTLFMNTPELATCTTVILLGFLSTLFMNTPELATCTMVIILGFQKEETDS